MQMRVIFAAIAWVAVVGAAPLTETPNKTDAATTYQLSELTPRVFVRTPNYSLNSSSCMEYSYRLLMPRVKVLMYTCNVDAGGNSGCLANKHVFQKEEEKKDKNEGCFSLRPWYKHNSNYSFFLFFERRERKYGPHKKHLEIRKRKLRETGRVDARMQGEVKFQGIKPCSEACPQWDGPTQVGYQS